MSQSRYPKDYQAFLIRCWQEHSDDHPSQWRFATEEVGGNHEHKGFSNFEELKSYLLHKLSLSITIDLRKKVEDQNGE